MKRFSFNKNKIEMKPFSFFLLKLVLFFVLVFVLDYSIGNILRYFYFKQESGLQYRTNYSIEKTTADVLIFGSSRANHHYDPSIFEKRLNLSYYNVGRDGNYILYHSAVLKGILARYAPKIIILDFIGGEFKRSPDSYDRLSSLLPYYKSHEEMRSIIELKSRFEKIKMLSFIYPYNSSIFTIAVGNSEFNKKRQGDIQGFVPLIKVWNETIKVDRSSEKYEIDSIKVKAYETFIQNCINSKVKLFISCSPYFIKCDHTDYSINIGREIAKKYNVKFFDYSNNSIFTSNSSLFADIGHLNENGARLYSNVVLDKIINDNYKQ